MATFALISEGLTDQIILERIINQICGEDGVDVNPLQPLRDATDAVTAPHGGWELVLEYCAIRVEDALAANDYVVIHIDTDQGDHPNFGLGLTDKGAERSYDALVADAIEIIGRRIGLEFYRAHIERFLFAISVHTMESWLLLYLFDHNEPKNSLDRLNRHLRKRNRKVLVKEAPSYLKVACQIKRKRLLILSTGHHSLGVFLAKLVSLSDRCSAGT